MGFFSEKVDTSFLQSVFEFSAVCCPGQLPVCCWGIWSSQLVAAVQHFTGTIQGIAHGRNWPQWTALEWASLSALLRKVCMPSLELSTLCRKVVIRKWSWTQLSIILLTSTCGNYCPGCHLGALVLVLSPLAVASMSLVESVMIQRTQSLPATSMCTTLGSRPGSARPTCWRKDKPTAWLPWMTRSMSLVATQQLPIWCPSTTVWRTRSTTLKPTSGPFFRTPHQAMGTSCVLLPSWETKSTWLVAASPTASLYTFDTEKEKLEEGGTLWRECPEGGDTESGFPTGSYVRDFDIQGVVIEVQL